MLQNLTWSANVEGHSRPWKILAWDSLDEGGLPRELIVKHFRPDQREARAVEYIAARFAFETNIHAIEPEFVNFLPAFLEDARSLPTPPRDISLAEAGAHVAFAWNARAICLFESHRALMSLEEPGQIGEIIGVDTVLVNFDRSDQNVLFEPRADYRGNPLHLLYPIDWEKCFAGGDVSVTTLRNPKMLTMSRPWSAYSGDPLCALIRTASDFQKAIGKLGGWSGARARLDLMLRAVPKEWDLSAAQKKAVIDYFLTRVESTIKRLALPDDPDAVFPNFQGSLPLGSRA